MIARAFKEFAAQHGIKFPDEEVDTSHLEQFGLAASGNVTLLQNARGKIIVHLPQPEDKNFWPKLKKKARVPDFRTALARALHQAYKKYVK